MTTPLGLIERLTKALRIQVDDHGIETSLLREAISFIALCRSTEEYPTDGELFDLADCHAEKHGWLCTSDAVVFGRNVLQNWGYIQVEPIPLEECQPTEDDCDDGGMCWFYQVGLSGVGDWVKQRLATPLSYKTYNLTHWLPYWALPTPIMET
jgi:hypothetical protein